MILVIILLVDASQIVDDEMLWHMGRRFYCVVLCFVTISSYDLAEIFSFADWSAYPIDDVFVFGYDYREAH